MYRKSFNFHKLRTCTILRTCTCTCTCTCTVCVLYSAFLSPMQCPSISLHRSLWWQCHLPQVVLWGSRDTAVCRYPGGGGARGPLPGRLGSCDPLPPDPHQQLILHIRYLCRSVCYCMCDQLHVAMRKGTNRGFPKHWIFSMDIIIL